MNASLVQSGTDVSGDVTMSGALALTLTAQGTFTEPTLTMTMSEPQFEPATYTGTLSGNTMTGFINGSGFSNFPMNLTRQ
jgi:hypothetical protein